MRAAYQYFFSHLVYAHASLTEIIIEGHTLVAPVLVEGQTTDGQPIAMHNLNLWTFEHGKFKVLRIYMDTYPYRQALSHVLGSRAREARPHRMTGHEGTASDFAR